MSALHAALLDIQKTLRPAKRNRSTEEFDYADLPSILATCKRKLNEKRIVVTHYPSGQMVGAVFMASVQTKLSLEIRPSDEDSEFIATTASCPCPPDRLEYAACVTELRKIGLACLLGIVQAEQGPSIIMDGQNQAHRIVNGRRAAAEPRTPTREEYDARRAPADGK